MPVYSEAPKLSDEDEKLLDFLLEGAPVDFDRADIFAIWRVKFEIWGAGDESMDLYEIELKVARDDKRVWFTRYIATYQRDYRSDPEQDLAQLKEWAQAEDVTLFRVDEPEGDSCLIAEVIKPGGR
jgi:hypothetical protein